MGYIPSIYRSPRFAFIQDAVGYTFSLENPQLGLDHCNPNIGRRVAIVLFMRLVLSGDIVCCDISVMIMLPTWQNLSAFVVNLSPSLRSVVVVTCSVV